HEHEALGGGSVRRLYCRLTSFSRSLQIILRINLDGTEILKMPNIRAGKFLPSFTTTTGRGQNGREPERATKKAANLFQTYCFRWSPVAAGIQF
ncbi:hypothetical protein ACTQ4E_15660, partial [Lawsonibacter sp. LCP25S3_G6]|uniref:hypothetical protein n=1 Tax=unclassified Lawsonibacter TaxID=2617946 RepID=UPI003F949925